MSTVLIVDDEDRVRTFLNRAMAAEGHDVVEAAGGAAAIEILRDGEPVDLVLLDLVMPGVDGLTTLGEVAASPGAPPVIVLSGVADVAARVAALERGAADFVAKPFHLSELMVRARRQLGSVAVPVPAGPRILEVGAVRLDLDRRRVRVPDREAVLAEREFTLLAHLMYRRGQVCRKTELLHDVWGLDFDPGSNVVEVAVRRLRVKLGELPIETVRGVGYCFVDQAS